MTGGTSVEVCSREFVYPDECPCCGAAADGELAIRLRRSERTVGSDTARQVLFPYCRQCTEHVELWETGSMISGLLVLGGLLSGAANVILGNLALGAILFAGTMVLATFVTSMFRSRAGAGCRPSCATANKAVTYNGWSGSTSAFRFASPTFAARFAEHNEHQLVNVDTTLRALLERHERVRRQVPTPAAPYRVMPAPLTPDGWLDLIAGQSSRVARRMALRRALEVDHDDAVRTLLVDLVCASELRTLQAELAGRSPATRRRRVDETMAAVRADNLPRPLRNALVEALLDLRRDRNAQGT
jgi:hypothetical protein